MRRLLLALGIAAGLVGAAAAETAPVLVVDLDRVLRESSAAVALRQTEIEARRALQAQFDAIQRELEAEETRMVGLRETMAKEEFDELVVAFDQRVRAERRKAQEEAAALQARFAGAQSALMGLVEPLLQTMMRERGAQLVVDRKNVIAAAPSADVTGDLLERLDRRQPGLDGILAAAP